MQQHGGFVQPGPLEGSKLTLPAQTLAGNDGSYRDQVKSIALGTGLSMSGGVLRAVGSAFDGAVATWADLPVGLVTPVLESVYLVRNGSGVWLLNRKQSGLYQRVALTGDRAADWSYLGEWLEEFSDANFEIWHDDDTTRELKFSLADQATGTTVTVRSNDLAALAPMASAWSGMAAHLARTDNPHGVTAAQVGLGNVDNVRDADKQVSTAQAAAIATRAPLVHGHAAEDISDSTYVGRGLLTAASAAVQRNLIGVTPWATNQWTNGTTDDVPEGAQLYFTTARANACADARIAAQKGQAEGLAPLDAGGKLPTAHLPDSIVGQVIYKGLWDASTNTPTLPTASAAQGYYYITSAAGTYSGIAFDVGDWCISDGTTWGKVDNSDAITSFAGRVGAILPIASDYSSFYLGLNAQAADSAKLGGVAASGYSQTSHTHNYAGSSTPGGAATYAGLLEPISGQAGYKLGYAADGARTNPGSWGRVVMRYDANGETYGVRVDQADMVSDPGYRRIAYPGGGVSVTRTHQRGGAIAIRLPVGMTDTMVHITIKVYEYLSGHSFECHVAGYTYPQGNTWAYAPTAYIVENPNVSRQLTVRFGCDSVLDKAIIYIGELNSVWAYPQVYVTEVLCGYGGYGELWASGWQIDFEASAFKNVTATVTDCQVGYRPANVFTGTKVIGGTSCSFVNGLLVS